MRQQLEKLADDEGISINQFFSLALAEKITRVLDPIEAVPSWIKPTE
jgi:hypothetical protein